MTSVKERIMHFENKCSGSPTESNGSSKDSSQESYQNKHVQQRVPSSEEDTPSDNVQELTASNEEDASVCSADSVSNQMSSGCSVTSDKHTPNESSDESARLRGLTIKCGGCEESFNEDSLVQCKQCAKPNCVDCMGHINGVCMNCLLYTSPSPRD